MPMFSLIVATRERKDEVARLIKSIEAQSFFDYEVILVDQNDDDRLKAVIADVAHPEKLRIVKSHIGVSRARNLGIAQAKGEILAFPDDDCWYPPGVLLWIAHWFEKHSSENLLSLTSRDENGVRSGNRWRKSPSPVSLLNVFRTSVCYCIFVRRNVTAKGVRFDEGIGPGAITRYLASEDTDFVITALRYGNRGTFDATAYIGHPRKDVRNSSVSPSRTRMYGAGMGYVLRKHHMLLSYLVFVVYDVLRAVLMMILRRPLHARCWFSHARGLGEGFFRMLHGANASRLEDTRNGLIET